MNRIYSKVWNKELGQLVVASELASSDSVGASGASRAPGVVRGALALAILLALVGLPGPDAADALGLAITHAHAAKAMARLALADGVIGAGSGKYLSLIHI